MRSQIPGPDLLDRKVQGWALRSVLTGVPADFQVLPLENLSSFPREPQTIFGFTGLGVAGIGGEEAL